MSIYGDKKRSLLEQKKLQWAKEREELSQLSMPWGRTYTKLDKNIVREKNLSKFSNSEVSLNREEQYSSRNLPPISRNKSYDQYEIEGDTSGYASDAKEGSPEYYLNSQTHKKEHSNWNNWHHRSSESDVSVCRDERPKWGDRGLAVAPHWDPNELNEHVSKTEPPGWLQRRLQNDSKEVLIVNSNSPETGESSTGTDRPYTGESANTNMYSLRTYLRGQNIPLEPNEIAERERKRQKAIELQNAIKQQLEEREIKRKQEREKKLREEEEEESRIRREQEIERLRVEEEQKLITEKKEREKKRNQAMHEALENAEKAAKLEKSKQKNLRVKHNLHSPKEEIIEQEQQQQQQQQQQDEKPPLLDESSNMMLVPSPRNIQQNPPSERNSASSDNFVNTTNEQNTSFEMPRNYLKPQENINDNVTLVLPNPFDSFQGMQLALLVPTAAMNVPNALPVAVPLSATNEQSVITENRVLTPTIYRMRRSSRDMSTQTDSSYFRNDRPESSRGDSYGSLDRSRNSVASERKDRRMRSEERIKDRVEKPKWGVNKPPMRYLKQSEKDPAYQKRKMRQKTREIIYEDKNNNYSQSSDDSSSQTPDHKMYRKQSINRNMWHKNERMFSQNISVYQTEIVPLELDRQGRLYVKDRTDFREEKLTKQKYRDSTPDSSRLERIVPRVDTRKERLNDRNERQKYLEREESECLLVKLDNLRHGLLLKQQQWDDDNSSIRTNKSTVEFPDVHDNS